MIHTYEVTGMHCQSCVGKLTGALKEIPSVTGVTVTLSPPEATVEMSSHVPTSTLEAAANTAGKFSFKERAKAHVEPTIAQEADTSQSLAPLFIIVGYILGGVILRAAISGDVSVHTLMGNFMGGFFIVFSLFKMINLSGFADGYSTYDVLAKRSRGYALTYPFVELALGVAYLTAFAPALVNTVTLVLMIIGSIGVAQALREKRAIQCACLGTALKLPMTKVTLAEDVVMGLMALVMLAI